jgi:hypothetical protein
MQAKSLQILKNHFDFQVLVHNDELKFLFEVVTAALPRIHFFWDMVLFHWVSGSQH